MFLIITILIVSTGFFSCNHSKTTSPRETVLFDFDWLFHPGEVLGGQDIKLDDSDWRINNLPHDWSIEDLPGRDSPFDSLAVGGIDYGYLTGGTAWYRKKFTITGNARGKNVSIYFDRNEIDS